MLSTSIVLSSDDESMAEFIGKLSLPDNPPIQKDHISQQGVSSSVILVAQLLLIT